MVVAWLLFPLVLVAVCVGCGLAVERVGGWLLPGTVLPSVGLALVIVAATLTTSRETTAPLSTAVVVVLAIAGYATSWPRLRALRLSPWPLAVGLGVFAVCAAPVVLSGSASFLGYFELNDTATHFLLIDQAMSHAYDLSRLGLSSYSSTLAVYLTTSYPIGADVAVGAVRPLVGQDIAWIFQPYLAVMMAFGAAAIWELLLGVVRSFPLRAACAFIAAQAGLVYAYYLEASIKELATAWIITVTVVLVFTTLRERLSLRGLAALIVTTVAGFDILDLAIAPWIGIPLAVFVVAFAWKTLRTRDRFRGRRLVLTGVGALALLGVLGEPIIGRASTFFTVVNGVLGSGSPAALALGNLVSPLPRWEMMGIWLAGDFRYPPGPDVRITYVLIGIAIFSAIVGALWLLRRRAFAPLLLLVGNGIAMLYLFGRGSPYADAKVMMIFSLTAVLIAMLGAVAMFDYGRRVEGWLLLIAISGGVLWTNALQYHSARVGPRQRFDELASIGNRFAGTGPTFYNQVDEFAVHFLRRERPYDSSSYAGVTLRAGLPPRPAADSREPWDPDELQPAYIQSFPLLVLGRSPEISRPPANFKLVYQGHYYDVWRRESSPQILDYIPLGNTTDPEAVPSCRLVMTTAAQARRDHARLAYVARSVPPTFVPTKSAAGVVDDPQEPLRGTVSVQRPGRYQVWLDVSLTKHFVVSVGGHLVGSFSYQLGPPSQFVLVGDVTLSAGAQPVLIKPTGSNLAPGAGTSQVVGPLMLTPSPDPPPVTQIEPSQARSLCGQSLDWIEIVR